MDENEKAIFAAGCFWGVQAYFDQVPGVVSSKVGYIGGHVKNPAYEDVCSHTTGHAQAVSIEYDSKQVTYETLLMHLFKIHDPTQLNRQGPDIGDNYRSAIFYTNEEQKNAAEKFIANTQPNYEKLIVTQVVRASEFYEAEDYHQKFTQRTGRGACHVAYQPMEQL